jgi:L-asparaginase
MKHKAILSSVVLVALWWCSAGAQAADTGPLPRIRVLGTGGTIAGAQLEAGGQAYQPGRYDVGALLRAVPDLERIATVTGEQVASVGSQDMNDSLWLELARRVDAALAQPDVDGALVTHGTDTLEETSYFLSLVVASPKPVVLVGAMRPATAPGADGPANLQHAFTVLADPAARGRGTLVCMDDAVHYARNVVKTSTTSAATFQSINRGPAGRVRPGRVEWYEPMDRRRVPDPPFAVHALRQLPRVDVIYAHAGMSPDLIDAAVRNGARGIVVAGVGDGNVSQAALERLARAAQAGVVIVRSTRLVMGSVARNVEIDDDSLGFVAAGELNPAKARVLLLLALTRTSVPAEVQRLFDEH